MDTVTVREGRRFFVGRNAELETLADHVGSEEARVLYLHGIAGIGKSALLMAFLQRAREAGASVVQIDCRTVRREVPTGPRA